MANTGWRLDYINSLPEEHLLFAYHYLTKKDNDYWERFGSHMGTVWDRDELRRLVSAPSGPPSQDSRVFIPLSLVVNPDLPAALLGKKKSSDQPTQSAPQGGDLPSGDGLNTGMSLPIDSEVVNMAELPKEEFLAIIAGSGMVTTRKK